MWALSEVAAMVQKAARGAGIPLGQAEDLGRTARFLAGTGADVSVISAALQEPASAVDVVWSPDRIEVTAGSAALIAPIVRDAFAMGCAGAVLTNVAHVRLVLGTLAQAGVSAQAERSLVRRCDTPLRALRHEAIGIPDADWALWADLAARTYVPESDASRAAGAGAGLTDND